MGLYGHAQVLVNKSSEPAVLTEITVLQLQNTLRLQ